jgi:LmbE family N-acetylglucosaminyl deacetylase
VKLLLSPHNDDEALFASYICLREHPKVIAALNGGRKRHYATPETRVAESAAAMEILGCEFEHLWVPCDPADWEAVERRLLLALDGETPEHVWAPLPEPNGHRQHNRLAHIALRLWPDRVSFYSTYHVIDGWPIRSVHGHPVDVDAGWPELKRQALDCYRSQIESAGTAMHFERPLDEYELHTLRLNLGGGINPLAGYINLDKSDGWIFEDGLEAYSDGSVEAITISHVLMYVPLEHWPSVFAELARVLKPCGTIRITEDAIGCPDSNRPVIRPRAAVATTPALILAHLEAAGLHGNLVDPNETSFADDSLIQQNYGQPPDVFHAEAVKGAQ